MAYFCITRPRLGINQVTVVGKLPSSYWHGSGSTRLLMIVVLASENCGLMYERTHWVASTEDAKGASLSAVLCAVSLQWVATSKSSWAHSPLYQPEPHRPGLPTNMMYECGSSAFNSTLRMLCKTHLLARPSQCLPFVPELAKKGTEAPDETCMGHIHGLFSTQR